VWPRRRTFRHGPTAPRSRSARALRLLPPSGHGCRRSAGRSRSYSLSEVLRLLRDDPRTRNIPVIVLSADALPSGMRLLLDAGVRPWTRVSERERQECPSRLRLRMFRDREHRGVCANDRTDSQT
jgi:hypothetical protein